MKLIRLKATVALGACALLPCAATGAEIPRTPWGAPDLQGTWDFRSITPFERPESFADREFLTRDEVEEFEEAVRQSRAARAAAGGEVDPSQGDVDVGYNSFWLDLGENMTGTMRTSLVVYPKNGRMPARTALAKRRSDENYARWGALPATAEDRNPFERCLIGFNAGPPMNPGAYNNMVEIVQSEHHVALMNEMVNDHRIIPLDGSPHVSEDIRLYKGDSRGRWEGETLVVVTRNFNELASFRGSGPNMVLTERFTRNSEGTLLYEYTVDDPESFEDKWSVALEMKKTTDPILEYACHEGNRAMTLMLSGARHQEQEGRNNKDWLATWYGGEKTVEAAKKRLEESGKTPPQNPPKKPPE